MAGNDYQFYCDTEMVEVPFFNSITYTCPFCDKIPKTPQEKMDELTRKKCGYDVKPKEDKKDDETKKINADDISWNNNFIGGDLSDPFGMLDTNQD